MSIAFIILIALVVLVAIFLIIAVFTKKGYFIQRSIIINQPSAGVFNFLSHINNQDKFSKWVMTDPAMKKTFKGTDGTVGYIYQWEGNRRAGKGEQEIIALDPGKKVGLEVRFEKPFKAIAHTPFSIEAVSDEKTNVNWSMRSEMRYPMNIMLLFMNMEKLLGKDMEESLGNLKRILEN